MSHSVFLLFGPNLKGNYELIDPFQLLSQAENSAMAQELSKSSAVLFRSDGQRLVLRARSRALAAGASWLVSVYRGMAASRSPWVLLEPTSAESGLVVLESAVPVKQLARELIDSLERRLAAAPGSGEPRTAAVLSAAERAGLLHAWAMYQQSVRIWENDADVSWFQSFLAQRIRQLGNDPERGLFELAERAVERGVIPGCRSLNGVARERE